MPCSAFPDMQAARQHNDAGRSPLPAAYGRSEPTVLQPAMTGWGTVSVRPILLKKPLRRYRMHQAAP